jgi:hypothetical protein
VGLETDAVDLNIAGFEALDEVKCCGCFCTRVFDVIAVVVEFDVWVVEDGGFEGDGDVFGTNLLFLPFVFVRNIKNKLTVL